MWMLSLYLHVNQKSDDDDDDEFRDTIKKIISFSIKFKKERLTEILQAVRVHINCH